MPIKKYADKTAIYADGYDIAIKFVLIDRIMFSGDHYAEIYKRFKDQDNYVMEDCGNAIRNIPPDLDVSVGHFLQIPIKLPDGSKSTAEFIFLEHETGPEIWIALGRIAKGIASSYWSKIRCQADRQCSGKVETHIW